MLLRVREALRPGPDDMQSSTLIQEEVKVPLKDWGPLEGPVSAAFLVEKGGVHVVTERILITDISLLRGTACPVSPAKSRS